MTRGAALALRAAALALLMTLAACQTEKQTTQRSAAADSIEGTTPNSTSSRRKQAEARLDLAVGYYTRRQYPVALEELNNAQAADPTFPAIYNARGLVYMDLKENALADDNFQRALRLEPGNPETNNNYGWFLCQSGKPQQSISYFDTAVKATLYATPAVPMRNAGLCSAMSNNMSAALDYLQRSFQFDPGNPVTMFNLADVLMRTGELERAHFYARRLNTTIDPTAQTIWLQLRIDRKYGDRESEASLTSQLRRRFPDARETDLLNRGIYNE
jgi:type IV pilus assembly protein PilF